jgi:hypothetical protein
LSIGYAASGSHRAPERSTGSADQLAVDWIEDTTGDVTGHHLAARSAGAMTTAAA